MFIFNNNFSKSLIYYICVVNDLNRCFMCKDISMLFFYMLKFEFVTICINKLYIIRKLLNSN